MECTIRTKLLALARLFRDVKLDSSKLSREGCITVMLKAA